MFLIIPLGGLGIRYKNNNYQEPKSLIQLMGKPIIFWILDNLRSLKKISLIYIPYHRDYVKFNLETLLIDRYPHLKFKFLILHQNTRGAADTIQIALDQLDILDQGCLCLDGDNFYTTDIISECQSQNKIFIFEDIQQNPIFSYIQTQDFKVLRIQEKEKISDLACSGGYYFNSYQKFRELILDTIDKNISHGGEFYISTVIQNMINQGNSFTYSKIPNFNYFSLGTPLQLRLFFHNFHYYLNCNPYLKIETPSIAINYLHILKLIRSKKNIVPLQEFLNCLSNYGSKIKIYLENQSHLQIEETLQKNLITYHEIIWKIADSDLVLTDIENMDYLEKKFGYYPNKLEVRNFNTIIEKDRYTFIKKSNFSLEGEIYYYQNIPSHLQFLFPNFIKYTEDKKEYEIEKINGITISEIYVNGLLSPDLLKTILDHMRLIQNTQIKETQNINIYDNYQKKLESRYQTFDYDKFPNSYQMYQKIRKGLVEYQNQKCGKQKVIHGDLVFTNILIDSSENIKLIDMRGKIGDKLSIEGDWLYDWAKIYQSLIGYDEILKGRNLDPVIKKKMISYFETYFLKYYQPTDLKNLKLITQSLIFSLIPLHNNEKCQAYYSLLIE